MLITSSRVNFSKDKKKIELCCECGYLFTVTVRFSDDYKTAAISLHSIFINPLVAYQTQYLIEKHRDYLIKQAKKRVGIKLLRELIILKNLQGYCLANNMNNTANLVLEIEPNTDKELIDILPKFREDFGDVFHIENFKYKLINHKHVLLIDIWT